MGEYAIQHLKELDDSAVQFGLSPDVEARFGRKAMGGRQSGLSYQRLAPGYRQSFGHRHERQEETYVIVSGSGRIKIGDEVHDVRALDAIRLDPAVPRAFEAGPDGLELVAFGAGESGDAEILEDFWPAD
ncbi:MAG TPA: cupin domain-containing protein [Gaiellaceae bacterium]|nr:cupin domain-containing protein [Gaiellaceae bacterium]